MVDLKYEAHVARLALNRPDQRNALSIEMCNAISEAVRQVDSHTETRVAVISGTGEVFCAGADLSAVSGPHGVDFILPFERMLETVARCRVPVIASIHGAALGGGLQLASACDFRIATAGAKLGIPSSRLGVVVNFENVRRLALLVGFSVAKEILMAGRSFTGAEAVRIGLINESVDADVDETADRWAHDIAALAPLSVQGAKSSFRVLADGLANVRRDAPEAVAELDALVREAYESADLAEGLAALREKRPSDFHGS